MTAETVVGTLRRAVPSLGLVRGRRDTRVRATWRILAPLAVFLSTYVATTARRRDPTPTTNRVEVCGSEDISPKRTLSRLNLLCSSPAAARVEDTGVSY